MKFAFVMLIFHYQMRFKAEFFLKYTTRSLNWNLFIFSICIGILSDMEFCKEERFSNRETFLERVLDVVEALSDDNSHF